MTRKQDPVDITSGPATNRQIKPCSNGYSFMLAKLPRFDRLQGNIRTITTLPALSRHQYLSLMLCRHKKSRADLEKHLKNAACHLAVRPSFRQL